MTIYRVSVGNREYHVEVAGNRLRIDGEQIQANLTALNELGLYLLRKGNQRRQMLVSTKGTTVTAQTEGRHLVAQVEKENGRNRRKNVSVSQGDVFSPMPGIIIQVLVAQGEAVQKGQAVVIMESMKMQMELRAPISGRVEAISVQPHSQVEKGTLLVKITA